MKKYKKKKLYFLTKRLTKKKFLVNKNLYFFVLLVLGIKLCLEYYKTYIV